MAILPGYHTTLVIQQDPETGCIPAGIEWMLRYLKIENVAFDGFQERYDLKEGNHFGSTPRRIMEDYPHLALTAREFESGEEKTHFMRQLIERGIPLLLALTLTPRGGWHIVPVVEIDEREITVLWMMEEALEEQKKRFLLREVEFRHDHWPGGRDILYWNAP